MHRESLFQRLGAEKSWDIAVIGGGATGLGVALESASRGYRTVLFEQHDFCQGTSSKSTKLIHGGVRYLAQGNLTLVLDALRERGILMRNAPDLVARLPLIVPAYRWSQLAFYGTGLGLYDLLAGRLGIGRTRILDRRAVIDRIPTIRQDRLRGGILFFDGQFDDTRLGIALLQALSRHDGLAINYCEVGQLRRRNGGVAGVVAVDRLGGRSFEVEARVVINAAGPQADRFRLEALPGTARRIAASQGSHLVFDRRFLPGDSALLVPKTDDGRVLFAIPWLGKVVAGTTDIPVGSPSVEPIPGRDEAEFILNHMRRYFDPAPEEKDILSMFAGLRPLVRASSSTRTASLSRDHVIEVLGDRMISVMGGKWTTYRKMGEDAVDQAASLAGLPVARSNTRNLPLTDSASMVHELPMEIRLHPRLPLSEGQVVRFVAEEWACTIEDVLARRSRCLLLDAAASIEAAPAVARIMARELDAGEAWQGIQVRNFLGTARHYLPFGQQSRESS